MRFDNEKAARSSLERELSISPNEELLTPKKEPYSNSQSQSLPMGKRTFQEDDVESPHDEEQKAN